MLASVLASRTVGLTAMNRQSSRSHAVLTLHIEQQVPGAPASSQAPGAAQGSAQGAVHGGGPALRRSQMNLVDLAGSERCAGLWEAATVLARGCNLTCQRLQPYLTPCV